MSDNNNKWLMIGIGTLHDTDSLWFPSSPYMWMTCSLLDRDKMSRPHIVSDLRSAVDFDLPSDAFDFVMTAHGVHGEILTDRGFVDHVACTNISNMMRDGGLFVCYFPQASKRAMLGSRIAATVSDKRAIDQFVDGVTACVKEFTLVSVDEVKRNFFSMFGKTFFNSSERSTVLNKMADQLKWCVVFKKNYRRTYNNTV